MKRFTGATGVWLVALTLCAPGRAPAATDNEPGSSGLEEIVVTAQKRADPLSKVPISISAFDQKSLDIQGVRTFSDLAALTPGLTFQGQNFGAGGGNFIAIRGILSGNETLAGGNTTNPTGLYIDDVAIQSRRLTGEYSGDAFPEIFDLERIEVLRGPQGTLFGAGAEGGAVRFITPQPSLTETSGYTRVEGADIDHGAPSYEAGVAFGAPISTDVAGFRVSAWYRRDGGWIDRVGTDSTGGYTGTALDRNSNYKESEAFKAALVIAPVESLLITPSVYYQEVRGHDASSFWVKISNPDDGMFRNGNLLQEPVTDKFVLPAIKLTANFGSVALTSDTAYFHRDAFAHSDYTNFVLWLFTQNPYAAAPGISSSSVSENKQNNFSEEIRLQSTDNTARLTWLVGAFYSDAHQVSNQEALSTFTPPIFNETLETIDKQAAIFGNLNYKITDTWSATAGLRAAHDTVDFSILQGGLALGPSTPPYVTGSESGSPVTPKFVVSNQLSENNLVYFSAGEGYRLGGPNGPVGNSSLSNCGFNPPRTFASDKLWSYEVGDKGRFFGNRLAVDASVYYIDWRNIQQTLTLACGFEITENLGKAVSKGFDLSLQYLLLPGLQISEALGYTHANYTQTVVQAGLPGVVVSDGDTLGVTPWTSTLALRYDFPIGSNGVRGYIFPQWIFHSHNSGVDQRLDPAAVAFYNPAAPLDRSTNLINLRLGANLGGFDLSIFANNLGNAHPLLSVTEDNIGSPLVRATTFQPRTIGLTAIHRF